MMSLMKQAQSIGGRLKSLNEQLKSKRATGSAGGGLVEFEVNGMGEVLRCRIDASLLSKGDREMLEDLAAAAANDAAAKARTLHMEAMQGLAGGMELPGLDDALAKLTGMASTDPEADGDVPMDATAHGAETVEPRGGDGSRRGDQERRTK
jgi:DNA-binding YbaB/EbfC family protein